MQHVLTGIFAHFLLLKTFLEDVQNQVVSKQLILFPSSWSRDRLFPWHFLFHC